MPVIRNLQSSAFKIRHSVEEIFLKQPGRQRGCCKPGVATRYAKKENFLPGRENPFAKDFWENFAKPCPASEKTNCSVLNRSPWLVTNLFKSSRSCRLEDLGAAILHAQPQRVFYQHGHRAARHQNAAMGFKNPCLDVFKRYLWIFFFEARRDRILHIAPCNASG